MASLPDEFDDGTDDEQRSPLLPPEDRLWRHPSEISSGSRLALDPVAVRSRWLSSAPSKASAWTAGFVGALLATGLVVVGTHLASVLATPPERDAAANAVPITTAATPAASPNLGSVLTGAVARVGNSLAVIDAATSNGTSEGRGLGIVISSDGTVLTAAVAVADAASILVYLPGDTVPSVGRVVGLDLGSGLAVVKVRGASGIPVTQFTSRPLSAPSFTIALTAPATAHTAPAFSVGALEQLNVAAITTNGALVDSDVTDLSASLSPPGSPLLDADGRVEAIITGSDDGYAVAAPGWLADPIANELISHGAVDHGWVGVSGQDQAAGAGKPAGVRILGVSPKSAAAKAGLRAGDVILSVDDQRVTTMSDLRGRLYVLSAGTPVSLRFERGTKIRTAALVLSDSD